MSGTLGRRAVAAYVLAVATWPRPGHAATLRLAIENMAFTGLPSATRVGDTIEWSNRDIVPHTVTARDGSFDTVIPPGETGLIAFRKPGKVAFCCRYHPTMVGVIDIRPG